MSDGTAGMHLERHRADVVCVECGHGHYDVVCELYRVCPICTFDGNPDCIMVRRQHETEGEK